MGVRKANRMVNSCALCGLCTAVCPEDFSMADVILDARRSMVKSGKMPPSAHDFALRDMAFSQSEAYTLARHQPGYQSSRTAFLPGCQLSASSPDHVVHCYEHLRNSLDGGVGLILQCCGAPVFWAGNDEIFQQTLHSLDSAWQKLGKPRMITACSSCYRALRDHLPQIPIEPLWPHLRAELLPQASRTLAIHDPCSTRGMSEVEGSARVLLGKLGVTTVELNEPGLTTCCGYGGLMLFANPELAAKTVTRRANESNADYVTYCAMCRDRFAHHGKRAIHILDLVFAGEYSDTAARPDPGFSRRQENRAQLKSRLLRDVWGEKGSTMEPSIEVKISEEVRALLEERMILIEDVRRTVAHAEQSGEKIENPATGRSVASFRPVSVTYWVEYSPEGAGFTVHNAYSHRMEVR
jgi:Fe-S oxidoreductase